MSGAIDSLGKVFRPVIKTVKKVAPYALAAAAVYFTAGAALGLPGTAGGWGAAAQRITDFVGGEGVLGNVLAGAITQAGYGAAAGLALSAVTGGDITKGTQFGAATGAVTGGISGGFGLPTDPFRGIGEETAAAAAPAQTQIASADPNAAALTGGPSEPTAAGMGLEVDQALRNNTSSIASPNALAPDWTSADAPMNAAVPGSNITADAGLADKIGLRAPTGAAGGGASEGGLFDKGGWVERNGNLTGNVLRGFGPALAGLFAETPSETDASKQRTRQEIVRENYGAPGRGLLSGPNAGVLSGPQPAPVGMGGQQPLQNPQVYAGRYVYDARQGRVVFMPNVQPVA